MIAVKLGTPVELLRPHRSFKSKAQAKMQNSANWSGSLIEQFAFHREVGEIKAYLTALEHIYCTAKIQIKIEHDHDMESGEIVAWNNESHLISEEAAQRISELVRNISRKCSMAKVDIHYKLERTITDVQ
jgi:hypothetical protein